MFTSAMRAILWASTTLCRKMTLAQKCDVSRVPSTAFPFSTKLSIAEETHVTPLPISLTAGRPVLVTCRTSNCKRTLKMRLNRTISLFPRNTLSSSISLHKCYGLLQSHGINLIAMVHRARACHISVLGGGGAAETKTDDKQEASVNQKESSANNARAAPPIVPAAASRKKDREPRDSTMYLRLTRSHRSV